MGIAWLITVLVLNACYFDPERAMIQFDDHIFSTGLVQPPTILKQCYKH